ncbi:hypothetical protein HNP40_000882 [Mycobacteroides chelonae]|nr:hypothetical protein [Mycobacteroides chelonae]
MVLKRIFACGACARTTLSTISNSSRFDSMARMPAPMTRQSHGRASSARFSCAVSSSLGVQSGCRLVQSFLDVVRGQAGAANWGLPKSIT